MEYRKKIGKSWYSKKKHGKTWFTVNIIYCKKPKLVNTQVPDVAYHDSPDQCTHHGLNIIQNNSEAR